MDKLLSLLALLLGTAVILAGNDAGVAELKVGEVFPRVEAQDQYGKVVSSGAGYTRLLLSFSRATGTALNDWLEKSGAAVLEQPRALVVADMHGMPGFVKGIVYRSLRKLPHRILLNESESALARVPRRAGRISVVDLDTEEKIVALDFVDPEKDLESFFRRTP